MEIGNISLSLVARMAKEPSAYAGTFSFVYKNERITQVIHYSKHADTIFSIIA